MYKIGFLGLGKMGSAILNGMINNNLYKVDEIAFYAPSFLTQDKYKNLGLNLLSNEYELIDKCQIIILAIKPQIYDKVFENIIGDFKNKIIISLAPGKSIKYLENIFKNATIVRAMPNTSAFIGKSVTTIAFNKLENIEIITNIFKSFGTYQILPESKIDETIPLNGSMPAYILEFAKDFIDSAVSYGIDYNCAKNLCLNSIIGSALLALNSNESLDVLIDNVCSKGGATIKGLNDLKRNKFDEIIKACYDACVKRSKEL